VTRARLAELRELALDGLFALATSPVWVPWWAWRRAQGRALPLLLVTAALAGACGGPPRAAQLALSTTAEGLVLVDVQVAERIPEAAEAARAAAREIDDVIAALAAYDAAMAPWVRVERVLLEAKSTLLLLQHALDAWAAGASDGKRAWLDAVACAVPSIDRVAEVLGRAGAHLPPQLARASRLLVAFAGGTCPDPDRPAPEAAR
jgi:hypothetical protein